MVNFGEFFSSKLSASRRYNCRYLARNNPGNISGYPTNARRVRGFIFHRNYQFP